MTILHIALIYSNKVLSSISCFNSNVKIGDIYGSKISTNGLTVALCYGFTSRGTCYTSPSPLFSGFNTTLVRGRDFSNEIYKLKLNKPDAESGLKVLYGHHCEATFRSKRW